MDPLDLLRQYTISNRLGQVLIAGDRIQFGDQYDFPKNVITAYKSQSGQGDFYDLETLLVFLENKTVKHSEYLRSTKQSGVQAVTFQDRKTLLDYLTGAIETCPNVQFNDEHYQATVLAGKRTLGQAGAAASLPQAKHARRTRRTRSLLFTAAAPTGVTSLLGADCAFDGPWRRRKVGSGLNERTGVVVVDAGGVPGIARDGLSEASRERTLRNRNSMLSIPGKDFLPVIVIAEKALSAVENELKRTEAHGASQKPRQPSQAAVKASSMAVKSSGRMDRAPAPTPKEFTALGIDMYGTKTATAAAVPAPPPPTKPSKPKIFKHATNGTYVDHKGRPCDASGRLIDNKGRLLQPSSSSASRDARGGTRGSSGAPPGPSKAPALKSENIPLIIVPEGLSALINMYNAKHFLQEGIFVAPDVARTENPDKKDVVQIERPAVDPTKPKVKFHVTDRVPSSKSSEWRRVVCVVCQGKNWQFKNFPFKGAKDGNLVDTFANVCGIFFHYKNEEVPEVVRSWNVKILPLNRASRNSDITVAQEMFVHIRKFLDNKAKTRIEAGCVPKQLRYA